MSSLVIGIDIGTTSIAVVAVNEAGQQVASVTETHGAEMIGLPHGYAEQNPEILWQSVTAALRTITEAASDYSVYAVGLTGQMHSTLLLNEQGETTGNIITWQDKRSVTDRVGEQCPFELLSSRVTARSMEPTGCRLAPGYMGTTLFAIQELDQRPRSFCRASFVADWIGARLCEQLPVTDRSHAASSGLYDLHNDRWSDELLAATGTTPACLPRVLDSGAVIGKISETAANETGLAAGTKVCNAIGDNQAAVLSSLPSSPDSMLINIGTGGQIVWRIPCFERVDGMDTRYLPSVATDIGKREHEFMLVGAGLCGGDELAWINRTVRNWLNAFGAQKTEEEVWQQLAEQVDATSDDLPALTCEPFFSGTRPEPGRRAVFRDVGVANFTPANIARSILDGIAETMYGVYLSAAAHRPEVLTSIAMSGNGARQNPQLVRAVEKRFGVPTLVAPCREEAATGTAMLAGVQTGFWPEIQTAQARIHKEAMRLSES